MKFAHDSIPEDLHSRAALFSHRAVIRDLNVTNVRNSHPDADRRHRCERPMHKKIRQQFAPPNHEFTLQSRTGNNDLRLPSATSTSTQTQRSPESPCTRHAYRTIASVDVDQRPDGSRANAFFHFRRERSTPCAYSSYTGSLLDNRKAGVADVPRLITISPSRTTPHGLRDIVFWLCTIMHR